MIPNPLIKVLQIETGEAMWIPLDYDITAAVTPVKDGSPFQVRFNLLISDDKGNNWNDELDVPVWYDTPSFNDIGIDDGDSGILVVATGTISPPNPGKLL